MCWTLYRHIEADFVNYMEYVPYNDDNADVYSPKLLAMLLQICGYIDSIFKEMAKYEAFGNVKECQEINKLEENDYWGYRIDLARNAFEKLYGLSSNASWSSSSQSEIIAKLDWVEPKKPKFLEPFRDFSNRGGVPEWWSKYNDVKHKWHMAIRDANMKNVLEALAGAFLLNAVHLASIETLYQIGLVKPFWVSGGKISTQGDFSLDAGNFLRLINDAKNAAGKSHLVSLDWNYMIETPLFIYKHLRKPTRRAIILDVVEQLGEGFREGIVPIVSVVEATSILGVDEESAKAEIRQLEKDGVLFEPKQGYVNR